LLSSVIALGAALIPVLFAWALATRTVTAASQPAPAALA